MSSKSKTNPKFEKFWAILAKRPELEIPEDAKSVIFDCIEEAGFNQKKAASSSAKTKDDSAPKKISGWNLYMSEQMKTVRKDESIPPKERLSKIAELWDGLGDEGKIKWCVDHNVDPPKTKKPATKKAPKKDGDAKVASKKTKPKDDDEEEVKIVRKKKVVEEKKKVVKEEEEEEEEEEEDD
jgi:hypothetical protein